MDRRKFLLSSASATALAACSSSNAPFGPHAFGAQPVGSLVSPRTVQFTRLEIAEFSADASLVAALRAGVKAMKAMADARDVRSWHYWHYSHWMPYSDPPPDMAPVWDQCRHAQSYFLPWHRGFLYFFEKMVREISGNPKFALPYWDYYKNPKLPHIFAVPDAPDGSPNPLYWADRRSDVVEGLNYAAFRDTVTVFPWGPGETFEDLLEKNPHNRVHGQVGGSMGRVPTAVADPIFWLHHCNVDRYWSAWQVAGGHRHMPPPGELWWKETFAYNLDRSWSENVAAMNEAARHLGYTYSDVSLPVPPAGALLPARPPVVAAGAANAAGPLTLTLAPVTIAIPVDARAMRAPSLQVALEGLRLTELGERGGYTYNVYANLPEARTPLREESAFSIGEFGSFELSMPAMKGMPLPASSGRTLAFDLAPALARQARSGAPGNATLLLSFVPFGRPKGVAANAPLAHVARIRVG